MSKELHIIYEGYGCYAYSTTGKREDVVFATFEPEEEDEYASYPQAFEEWKRLITKAKGTVWTRIEASMDILDLEEFPESFIGEAEAMMEEEGWKFAKKRV